MYEINWANDATNDYYKTLNFWKNNNNSNTYSIKIMLEVIRLEDLLLSSPYLGTELPNKARRIVILNNYSLTYDVSGNIIKTLSFYDNRQNNTPR